jgi:hypothetical protein
MIMITIMTMIMTMIMNAKRGFRISEAAARASGMVWDRFVKLGKLVIVAASALTAVARIASFYDGWTNVNTMQVNAVNASPFLIAITIWLLLSWRIVSLRRAQSKALPAFVALQNRRATFMASDRSGRIALGRDRF